MSTSRPRRLISLHSAWAWSVLAVVAEIEGGAWGPGVFAPTWPAKSILQMIQSYSTLRFIKGPFLVCDGFHLLGQHSFYSYMFLCSRDLTSYFGSISSRRISKLSTFDQSRWMAMVETVEMEEVPLVSEEKTPSVSRRWVVGGLSFLMAMTLSVSLGYVYFHKEHYRIRAGDPSHSKVSFPNQKDVKKLLELLQENRQKPLQPDCRIPNVFQYTYGWRFEFPLRFEVHWGHYIFFVRNVDFLIWHDGSGHASCKQRMCCYFFKGPKCKL